MCRFIILAGVAAAALAMPHMGGNAKDCPFHAAAARPDEVGMAKSTRHTGRVSAAEPAAIAAKINAHLEDTAELPLKGCEQYDHDELNDLVRQLWCYKSAELSSHYSGGDKRALRYASLEAFEAAWVAEREQFKVQGAADALREAKCAEALMLYTHHLTREGKAALAANANAGANAGRGGIAHLPRLPAFNATHAAHASAAVAGTYKASFTCVSGHNQTVGHTSDHKFPHWPEEVHYKGMGHGAYPFWLGPSGSGGQGEIEVWWSEKQNAEKFYHASCGMSEAGASADAPCYHLFVGAQPNPLAYLYTADESFCCASGPGGGAPTDDDEAGPGGNAEKLSAPQSDFMDLMTYQGEKDLTTSFYSGKAKYYLETLPSTEPVTYFWYYTTMDDKPLQQGEGGNGGAGIQIWHDYNTSSFTATTHDPSVFAVPDVCKQANIKSCAFP